MAKWRRERVVGGGGGATATLLCLLLVPLLVVYGVWAVFAPPMLRPRPFRNVPGKYMWYAPHSGFSNQVRELRNALRVAAILGRTLILPPVTDHHALSLGSCPKYRIVEPRQLRAAALSHFSALAAQSRYYSIADVVNISAVSRGLVTTIDLRVFALLWCGADIEPACSPGGGGVCHALAVHGGGDFGECIARLNHAECTGNGCVRCVDESCAETVWTYTRTKTKLAGSSRRGLLSSPSSSSIAKLKMKKFDGARRVDRDVFQSLGDGTTAGGAKVLAFGSLFSGEYEGAETHVDLRDSSGDEAFDRVYHATEYLPLSQVIAETAGTYIRNTMNKREFFCAQLRLLDGQFKNHWSKTFGSFKSRLESVPGRSDGMAVFVMTDLPRANWTGTYLQELPDKYTVFTLEESDVIVSDTARRLLASELGIKSGIVPLRDLSKTVVKQQAGVVPEHMLPDMLLYLEEAICSCAALGFHGTAGSTISEMIETRRSHSPQPCS